MTDTPALLRSLSQSSIRSFVAVPLPGAVQTEIAEAARGLARALPQESIKWSRKPENLHVTMKFLGPVAALRLDALGAAMNGALAAVPRFGFGVRGWGAFPSERDAKVLFAGVDDERGLATVAEVVEAVSARLGFPREPRRFTGHVTIGRSKAGVDARAALAAGATSAFGKVEVTEVHVYESRLGQPGDAGSTYVLRHRVPLSARVAN
jgi:RNA 2',3'-cyclic 3'-phosphodiesterase